jgi:hypothetical protein
MSIRFVVSLPSCLLRSMTNRGVKKAIHGLEESVRSVKQERLIPESRIIKESGVK